MAGGIRTANSPNKLYARRAEVRQVEPSRSPSRIATRPSRANFLLGPRGRPAGRAPADPRGPACHFLGRAGGQTLAAPLTPPRRGPGGSSASPGPPRALRAAVPARARPSAAFFGGGRCGRCGRSIQRYANDKPASQPSFDFERKPARTRTPAFRSAAAAEVSARTGGRGSPNQKETNDRRSATHARGRRVARRPRHGRPARVAAGRRRGAPDAEVPGEPRPRGDARSKTRFAGTLRGGRGRGRAAG